MIEDRVIWKYIIPIHNTSRIAMPEGATILGVQRQDDAIVLWAQVDPNRDPVERSFHIFGTGVFVPSDPRYVYLATVQYDGFAWHVFEALP